MRDKKRIPRGILSQKGAVRGFSCNFWVVSPGRVLRWMGRQGGEVRCGQWVCVIRNQKLGDRVRGMDPLRTSVVDPVRTCHLQTVFICSLE